MLLLLMMPGDRNRQHRGVPASDLAYGAMLIALSWLFFILPYLSPIGHLTGCLLTSFVQIAAYHILGDKGNVFIYIATGLLAMIFPGPAQSLFYFAAVGLLPLMVLKLRRRVSDGVLRLIVHVVMTVILFGGFFLLGRDRFINPALEIPDDALTAILLFLIQIGLIVYFYLFSVAEKAFVRSILPRVRRNRGGR